MSKQKTILLIYGDGGHKQEMKLLYSRLSNSSLKFITVGPTSLDVSISHYKLGDVRHKNSRLKSLLMAFNGVLKSCNLTISLCLKYEVTGVISTGPGISIVPSLILKLCGKKVVFIETFCRFYSRSITGRIMSKISDEFWVQNIEQKKLYKNSKFCGRL
ncbi:PssD/Cps14F family polysaccharide biosynthesis glycosyltransferase [Pseudoalteromonas distincta]|uniref:PssD/Cps14F family polysaccharide biosynthesis glycosyltransferase n=1 Tax=Pseudoalteromonas distincta TaxID=77608 RepID=UPI00186A0637|nr:PssD/Cps14F family polysaccharide biosynthesis glycosyltransferase [Pseudoalteromonas distincta]MDC3212138.1 UDP-N-acetylglucosamine transferase subunit ALG14 [Pseudoalteromonas distincta]|tara:strand:+ start:115 stop:591 length:477 start_codon:yes stop_codon:yes gene_type:complete